MPRFVLMNLDESQLAGGIEPSKLDLSDKWILSSFNRVAEKVRSSLEAYRFNDAASALYDFIWHKYCDWYLEVSKLSEDKETTQKVLIKILRGCLKLLHPLMPFITEKIWQNIPGDAEKWIMASSWPEPEEAYEYGKAVEDMEKLIGCITSIRNIRSFWNIENKSVVDVIFSVSDDKDADMLRQNSQYIERLGKCKISDVGEGLDRPEKSVASLVGETKLFVPLGEAVDIDKELTRINKKISDIEKYLIGVDKKLSNERFLENAPAEVVDKEKSKRDKFQAEIDTLKENVKALK